jgi:tRNA nucleotidyltransferase (CCA-adding enzyme)
MRAMVDSGEVEHLVPERVWAELSRALAEPAPWRFIEVLRDCGALAHVFPEIAALFGVPQPQRHHPEIDCGVHLLLALQQVARLDAGPRVSLAVMLHDLGKATTPEDVLPSHIGHEERSVALIKSFSQRLRVPNAWRDLAILVARFHTACHRALELRPQTVLKMLDAIGAFKCPERLDEFLLACEADARGRKGLEQRPYPQAELIREASAAAAAVESSPLREQGHFGAALGEAIRRERLNRITRVVRAQQSRYQKSSNSTPPNSNR